MMRLSKWHLPIAVWLLVAAACAVQGDYTSAGLCMFPAIAASILASGAQGIPTD